MEHRLQQRQTANLPVKLIMHGKLIGTSRTMDISSGGVRVYNPGISLNKGRKVNIDFFKSTVSELSDSCMCALVIHRTDDFIGLMFTKEYAADCLVRES